MTRLTQALERAGAIPRQNADDVPKPVHPIWDLGEAAETPEVPQLSVRLPGETAEVLQLSVRPPAETAEVLPLSVQLSAETAEVLQLFLRPPAETAEVPQLSLRPPDVAEIANTMHELPSTATPTSIRCPRCERVQGVRTEVPGLWERTV